MKQLIPEDSSQLLSATIGDFPNLPGSASLAALGAVVSGADIIKVGLRGPKNIKEGVKLMKAVVKAVKTYNTAIKVVTAGYADFSRVDKCLDFLSIPIIAAESGAEWLSLEHVERLSASTKGAEVRISSLPPSLNGCKAST